MAGGELGTITTNLESIDRPRTAHETDDRPATA